MLLALDTCFNGCSAALFDEERGVVRASHLAVMERGHAEALGPMVAHVFAQAKLKPDSLTRIAVTIGPGTFTGLRIGLSYAKGMAMALGIPLTGISSLMATAAAHAGSRETIVVVHQAGGTGLFYWSSHDGQTAQELTPPAVASLEDIAAAIQNQSCALAGTGAAALHEVMPHSRLLPSPSAPDAVHFASFAAAMPISEQPVEPLYLRPPDAKPSVSVASSSAQVRKATGADLATMAEIHGLSFSKGWDVASLTAFLSIPGAGALVVELAGTIYGFVQFQWVAGEAEINTICVLPNYRRQHFGHDLMRGLEDHLRQHKTTRMFLEVAENNMAARKLYETSGFKSSGLRKAYYADGQNAVTMLKELAA